MEGRQRGEAVAEVSTGLRFMVTFEAFWKLYPPRGRTPRREKKKETRAAWSRLGLLEREAAYAGLQQAVERRDWLEPRYIPQPHRWLSGRRWEDEEPDEVPRLSPKEAEAIRSWRRRVGAECPHVEECATLEDCNEKQLRVWTQQGIL